MRAKENKPSWQTQKLITLKELKKFLEEAEKDAEKTS